MNPINGLYRKLRYPEGYRTTDIPQGILITHMMPPPSQPQNEIYVNGKNVVSEYEEKLLEEKLAKEYLKQQRIRETASKQKQNNKTSEKSSQPKTQQQAQVAAEVKQAEEADAEAQASINGEQQNESNIPVQGDPNAPPQYPGTNIQPKSKKLPRISQLQQNTTETQLRTALEAQGWRNYLSQTVELTKHDIREAQKAAVERAVAQKILNMEEDERKTINEQRLYNIIAQYIKEQTDLELTPDEFRELLHNPEEKIQQLTTVLASYEAPDQTVGGRPEQTTIALKPVKQEKTEVKLEHQTPYSEVPGESQISLEVSVNARGARQYSATLTNALKDAAKILKTKGDLAGLQKIEETLAIIEAQKQKTRLSTYFPSVFDELQRRITITPSAEQLANVLYEIITRDFKS